MKIFEQESVLGHRLEDDNKPITPPTRGASLQKDERPSEEPEMTAYDKELADSFPASDPPSY